jgi:proteasome lid subunit RPN8/RPN11
MSRFLYSLDFYPPSGTGWSLPFEKPDFGPLVEWAQLQALKRGWFPSAGTAVIEPTFRETGDSRLEGFQIQIPVDGGSFEQNLGFTCFADVAAVYRAALVKTGKLSDEECYWNLSAWPSEEGIEGIVPALSISADIQVGAIRDRLAQARTEGLPAEDDMKVLVPAGILEESAEAARGAAPMECGGVLLGHLRRDADSGELFAEVTALIPALRAIPSETELRFTPDAWKCVRDAAALRARGEVWLGWAHSHPVLHWECGQCPIERQRVCARATHLFSEQDRCVHRTVFPRAFSVGIVANVLSGEVVHSCFGWREGRIVERGIFVTEGLT